MVAFDGCKELARYASQQLGQTVLTLRFDEVRFLEQFDGVWACASLLHLPHDELVTTMRRLLAALKPGGRLMAVFKYGDGERTDKDGRHFTDLTPQSAWELVMAAGGFIDLPDRGRGSVHDVAHRMGLGHRLTDAVRHGLAHGVFGHRDWNIPNGLRAVRDGLVSLHRVGANSPGVPGVRRRSGRMGGAHDDHVAGEGEHKGGNEQADGLDAHDGFLGKHLAELLRCLV